MTDKTTFGSCIVDRLYRTTSDASNGNHSESTGSDSTTIFRYTDLFSGTEAPQWKSLVRGGGNATTYASGTRTSYKVGSFLMTGAQSSVSGSFSQNQTWFQSGSINLVPVPTSYVGDPGIQSDVTNRCIRKFLDRANQALSSVEAGQDVGEYKESLHGLVKPAGALQDYVFSFFPRLKKNLGKQKGRSALKTLADTYLEWNFGWKPLVEDVADAYVGLQNASRHFESVPVSASASQTFNGSDRSIVIDNNGPFGCSAHLVSNSKYTLRYKGAIRTGVDASGTVSTAQLLQLTPDRWLPTAWDLLPYSFIADYFANIGDIIGAYSFPSSKLSWACSTERFVTKSTIGGAKWDGTPANDAFGNSFSCSVSSGGNSVVTVTGFNRSPIIDLVPSFRFHIPTSKKPWFNMAAILVSHAVPFVKLLT